MISIKIATVDYFKKHFAEAEEKYLSEGGLVDRIPWGKLAEEFGLEGQVSQEEFVLLASGQHPKTGEQLVEIQKQGKYVNEIGKEVKPKEHRLGYDITCSPPKSVTAAVFLGGDFRVLIAYRESLDETLYEIQKFIQAKMGGKNLPETTGNMVAVLFEHDSDRPVDGFVAPQLHTHCVTMNMTQDGEGYVRALEATELYCAQHYFTTFFRASLSRKLMALGYEIIETKNGAFEIKGYTEEFIEALSPRAGQRDAKLKEKGLSYNATAAETAILDSREKKTNLSTEEVVAQWREITSQYGDQPQKLYAESLTRSDTYEELPAIEKAQRLQEAMNYAVEKLMEKEGVADETRVLAETLKFQMGAISIEEAKREFAKRLKENAILQVGHSRTNSPQAAITTPEMLRMETEITLIVKKGKKKFLPMAKPDVVDGFIKRFEARKEAKTGKPFTFNEGQLQAIRGVFASQDKIIGVTGKAGVGKTSVLSVIRDIAEDGRYLVEGFAPTGRAKELLKQSGIDSRTLQGFILGSDASENSLPHLYVLDESSISSTRMFYEFLLRIGKDDRVILLGDTKQHLAVEAGTPFDLVQDRELLKENVLETFHIGEIVRQHTEEFKELVGQLWSGEIREALEKLKDIKFEGSLNPAKGIVQVVDRDERLSTMVQDFMLAPEKTLCVAPDNRTRHELNVLIHAELKKQGLISAEERIFTVLAQTGNSENADRKRAKTYQPGDILRFSSNNKLFEKGEYVTVVSTETDWKKNRITVQKEDGSTVTYNPKHYYGIQIYRETERTFAVGDRIQFTSGDKARSLENREIGYVNGFDEKGVTVAVGENRDRIVYFSNEALRHSDYGYVLTSHSAQGETYDRVLIHADTTDVGSLINERMAYVSISRAVFEARIYTDNEETLPKKMAKAFGKSSALRSAKKAEKGHGVHCLSKKDLPNLDELLRKEQDAIEKELSVEQEPSSTKPRVEEFKEHRTVRDDRFVLGWEMAAALKLRDLVMRRDALIEQEMFRRFGVSNEGAERESSKFDVKQREKLRVKSQLFNEKFEGDKRKELLARLDAAFKNQEPLVSSVDLKYAKQLEKLNSKIQNEMLMLQKVGVVADEVREKYQSELTDLPTPIIRREVLDELHDQAAQRKDIQIVRDLYGIRRAQAIEFNADEWKTDSGGRLAAQIEMAKLQLKNASRKVSDFESNRHRWSWKVGADDQEWSLSDIDSQTAWKESGLRFRSNSVTFYEGLIKVVQNPGKRKKFQQQLIEARTEVQLLEGELAELKMVRPLVLEKISETRESLRVEASEAKEWLETLRSMQGKKAFPARYKGWELVQMEASAIENLDGQALEDFEKKAQSFIWDENISRTEVSAISMERLAQRAAAREMMVGVEIEKAQSALAYLANKGDKIRIAYVDRLGEQQTGSLGELPMRTFRDRMSRYLTRSMEGDTGFLGLDETKNDQSRLAGWLNLIQMRVEKRLGRAAAEGINQLKKATEFEKTNWREHAFTHVSNFFIGYVEKNWKETAVETHKRKAIVEALTDEERRLTQRLGAAWEFAQTCSRIREGYEKAVESLVKPQFTTKEAVRLEHHGIQTESSSYIKAGVEAAKEASRLKRDERFGSDHPLTVIARYEQRPFVPAGALAKPEPTQRPQLLPEPTRSGWKQIEDFFNQGPLREEVKTLYLDGRIFLDTEKNLVFLMENGKIGVHSLNGNKKEWAVNPEAVEALRAKAQELIQNQTSFPISEPLRTIVANQSSREKIEPAPPGQTPEMGPTR